MPKHHLVPQMYLKRFADADKKLTMVRRDDLTTQVPATVRTACRETGFYAIPTEDLEPEAREGHDPEAVEGALSKIERLTTPLIAEIVETGALPSLVDEAGRQARYQLSQFAALQMTRTWTFRREFVELSRINANRHLKAFTTDGRIKKFLARDGKPTRPQDIEAFRQRALGPDGPILRVPDSVSVQAALQFALEDGHVELFSRGWHLRVFDDPMLLTSDAPVVQRLAGPPGTPVPGLLTAEATYWPLDRRHLLSFERDLTVDKVTLGADPARAATANKLVASQADRWVFHHPDDGHLVAFELEPHPEFVTETVQIAETPDEVRVRTKVIRRQR